MIKVDEHSYFFFLKKNKLNCVYYIFIKPYNNKFFSPPLYPGTLFVGLVRVILLSRNQKETLNQYVDKNILIELQKEFGIGKK
jgi:hypothetical protein